MSNILVPDASVLLKWALKGPEENDSIAATNLFEHWMEGKVEIVLPRLWAYEVGNVLGLRNPSRAEELMDIFLGYGFHEVDLSTTVCRKTYTLTRQCRVSFYDAIYHAVALLHNGTLITADEAYHRQSVGIGQVRLLRDFPISP